MVEPGPVQVGPAGVDHVAGVVVDRPEIERALDIGVVLGIDARVDQLAGAQGVEEELVGGEVGKPGHAPVQGVVEAARKPVDEGVGAAHRGGRVLLDQVVAQGMRPQHVELERARSPAPR